MSFYLIWKLRIYKLFKILLSFDLKILISFILYRISPSYEHIKVFKKIKNIKTFIDIGSNKGQFSLLINNLYPRSKVLAFEPLNDEFKILKKIFLKNKNISMYNFALGNKNANMYMYKSNETDSSSFLRPSYTQIKFFPDTYVKQKIKVNIRKLKNFTKGLSKPIFLKIDVQGFELEVLKGSDLTQFKFIYLEASYKKLYTNQPLITDISKFLNSKNFKQVARYNLIKDFSQRPIQADFLFINLKK